MASSAPWRSHIKVIVKYYWNPRPGVRLLRGRSEYYFDSLLEVIWFLQHPHGMLPYGADEAMYLLVLGPLQVYPAPPGLPPTPQQWATAWAAIGNP